MQTLLMGQLLSIMLEGRVNRFHQSCFTNRGDFDKAGVSRKCAQLSIRQNLGKKTTVVQLFLEGESLSPKQREEEEKNCIAHLQTSRTLQI